MVDMEAYVEVTWALNNSAYYTSLGYSASGYGDKCQIKIKDLMHGTHTNIPVRCDKCGIEYTAQYADWSKRHERGKEDLCKKCANVYKNRRLHRRNRQELNALMEKQCKKKGFFFLGTQEEKVIFVCPKHGEQKCSFVSMERGYGCKVCSYEVRSKQWRKSPQEIQEAIEAVPGNKWLNSDEYVGVEIRNLRIKCGQCGEEFVTSFVNYSKHNKITCDSCGQKESVGERKIREYLQKNHIAFEQEKRFDDCRRQRALPFDFYLPDYNLCIEFDGQGHYIPGRFSSDSYQLTQESDTIKNQYCQERGIGLVRIPYFCGGDIDRILSEAIEARKSA